MLPHEVEPYANAHIDALNRIIEAMMFYETNPGQLAPQVVEKWRQELAVSISGFVRFKVCMVDELEQKERYRQTLRDHKIRPNLKKTDS
jgi:hypothetical protein